MSNIARKDFMKTLLSAPYPSSYLLSNNSNKCHPKEDCNKPAVAIVSIILGFCCLARVWIFFSVKTAIPISSFTGLKFDKFWH